MKQTPEERRELKRFNPVHPDAMVSEPDGTHVLYSEVEPLEAEVAANAKLIQSWVNALGDALKAFEAAGYTPTSEGSTTQ